MKFEGTSLRKSFWRFIWSSAVVQWISALYTMVDSMFAARGMSEVALSAVNITPLFVSFLFSVFILFAVGTSTIVAIFLGQGNHREADRAYTQNLVVLGGIPLVIMAAVRLSLDRITAFLRATAATMKYVKHCIPSILPFAWCSTISHSFKILAKTDSYPRFAIMAVTVGALLNCVLDYLFAMVFKWEVTGAGAAMGISRMVTAFLCLKYFLSPRTTIWFEKPRWSGTQLWRVIKIGLSSGLMELSAGFTVSMFNYVILRFIGEQGIISYTIIAYVNTIVVMSMAGIAQGTQSPISFYYGKGDEASCSKLLRHLVRASVGMAVVAFLAVTVGADMLVGVFISPSLQGSRDYSAFVFRTLSISFLFMGFNVVAGGFFTAIEKSGEFLVISLGRGVVTMVFALGACIALMGGAGIWWASAVPGLMCLTVTGVLTYRLKKCRLTIKKIKMQRSKPVKEP